MTFSSQKVAVARYTIWLTWHALSAASSSRTSGRAQSRLGLGPLILDQTGDSATYITLLIAAVISLGLAWLSVGSPVDSWN